MKLSKYEKCLKKLVKEQKNLIKNLKEIVNHQNQHIKALETINRLHLISNNNCRI